MKAYIQYATCNNVCSDEEISARENVNDTENVTEDGNERGRMLDEMSAMEDMQR